MDPLVELVAYDSVDHVSKPGPRELWQVSLLREVIVELWKVVPDVEEVLGGKPLVVGQLDDPTGGLLNNYRRISAFKATYTSYGPSPGP